MIPDIQINQICSISLNFHWIFFNHKTRFSLSISSALRTWCRDSTTLLQSCERREQQYECSRFTFFTFMKQIFCLQKSITYLWIEWGKRNYLNYRNFKNIFMIKDSGNKNLRVLVLFLKTNCYMRCSLDRQLKDSVISVLQYFINNCVHKLKPNCWDNIW